MNIIEFKKRWMMHYINPIYFYLPFEQCKGEEESLHFYIRIKIYNTYNPITGEFYNTKNNKRKQVNQSCEYFKILVTYLGEDGKGKEELVYCSFRGKYNNKKYYDTNDKEINQMADGSRLRYGKYRVKIWGTYGLGAPGKTWTFNLKESNNGKTFVLYVNWHLVKLQTQLGSAPKTWSTSVQGPKYAIREDISWVCHGKQDPIYAKEKISANHCLTSQTLTDLAIKDTLCTVPYGANPRSYYRSPQRGTACSIAASRPMYDVSEAFEEYDCSGYWDGAASFYQYYVNKYTTSITAQDINNSYKLESAIDISKDYKKIPNPCPITGRQGHIRLGEDIPNEVSPTYSLWRVSDLSSTTHGYGLSLFRTKKQQDRTANSWPLISSAQVETTSWRHAGQIGYQDYGETTWMFGGQCYTKCYTNADAYVPVGANFSTVIDGINYYNSDNHSYYYKYESDNIIHFSTSSPTSNAVNIEPFEVYERSNFSFGYKQGHYTKSTLQKKLPDIYSYKPWLKEVPADRFKVEIDASQGAVNYGVSNPTLFYLYDEQSWASCCCYALFKAIPTIGSVPNLTQFNKK